MLHLRRLHLQQTTITQYVSHLRQYLLVRGISVTLRSDQCQVLLACATRQDRAVLPLRLTQKIPTSCAVMHLVFLRIDRLHCDNLKLRHSHGAACAVASGLCCRIHEVLPDGRLMDADGLVIADHAIMTAHVAFRFAGDGRIYPASEPDSFPVGRHPVAFAGFHDSLKNWVGGSGTRQVAANPRCYPFCYVRRLFDYVVFCRPPPGGHLFPCVRAAAVGRHIKAVFDSVGLDGARGCCHAMRVGSESMAQALRYSAPGVTAAQEQDHGMWRSEQGLRPYKRSAFETGSDLSLALYDVQFMSINYLRWYYMSPAIEIAADGTDCV